MNLLDSWIATYDINTKEDLFNAKREIVQEITLAGLRRGNFFDYATFYGGTALRIFYGLDRYSEDLDFSLNSKEQKFSIEPFIPKIIKEFDLLNLDVTIDIKKKKKKSSIESAFLRDNSQWAEMSVNINNTNKLFPILKIKIEIDRDPPLGFKIEPKLLLRPYSFYVNCMKKEYLFAGKMHAVLFRNWKNNVKGRDWYDMVWYISNGVPLNLDHLRQRSIESGDWNPKQKMNKELFLDLLHKKIDCLNIEQAKHDISRFIIDQSKIEIWSKAYFKATIDYLKTTT